MLILALVLKFPHTGPPETPTERKSNVTIHYSTGIFSIQRRSVSCTSGACPVQAERVVYGRRESCTGGACRVLTARAVYRRRETYTRGAI